MRDPEHLIQLLKEMNELAKNWTLKLVYQMNGEINL